MPDYAVSASANDETIGDGANTNGTVLTITQNYTSGTFSYGSATIDTSAIGTDTITAATLYWYHDAYSKTKANAFSRNIAVGGTGILASSANPGAAGWHNEVLTSGEFALINKTGNTAITFNMDDPGSGFNLWSVRSWDYAPTGTYACYLAVTHGPAGGPTKFSILR